MVAAMRIKVYGEQSLSEAIGALRAQFKECKYFTVTISAGKARSISQNALLHRWCNQISLEEGQYSTGEVKCLVKLNIFMPIQRGEDAEYNDKCAAVIDVLPYVSKMKAMEIWPVTSLMKTKPLSRGLEAMQQHYADRVILNFEE